MLTIVWAKISNLYFFKTKNQKPKTKNQKPKTKKEVKVEY
jgi:hypothetical protein